LFLRSTIRPLPPLFGQICSRVFLLLVFGFFFFVEGRFPKKGGVGDPFRGIPSQSFLGNHGSRPLIRIHGFFSFAFWRIGFPPFPGTLPTHAKDRETPPVHSQGGPGQSRLFLTWGRLLVVSSFLWFLYRRSVCRLPLPDRLSPPLLPGAEKKKKFLAGVLAFPVRDTPIGSLFACFPLFQSTFECFPQWPLIPAAHSEESARSGWPYLFWPGVGGGCRDGPQALCAPGWDTWLYRVPEKVLKRQGGGPPLIGRVTRREGRRDSPHRGGGADIGPPGHLPPVFGKNCHRSFRRGFHPETCLSWSPITLGRLCPCFWKNWAEPGMLFCFTGRGLTAALVGRQVQGGGFPLGHSG